MYRVQSVQAHLAGIALAALVGSGLPLMTGCAQAPGTAQPVEQAEKAQADIEVDGEMATITWPDGCTDRHGDITSFAVAELDGSMLNKLLEQQKYVWNERNRMWVKEDGASALVVSDADGEPLSRDAIEELGMGSVQGNISYRLVTGRYSTAKRAFRALADRVIDCEDVAYLETSAVGVVAGPSENRCLVFVSKSNNVFAVTVFSEQAVAAGLLDDEAGQDLGRTIDDAFKTLTGRLPGES